MTERTLEVKLKSGLQARQAALFVQEANRFSSDIYLEKGARKVNAKSIMGIMSLAIARGAEVTLSADGHDEENAVTALASIIEDEAAK
ncbi:MULTISPECIES: HPr family phosphocarrier protein [Bhargavaea]|uniref:HPr family phosphocarrier protein n=1 Tax=Bhargavaea changchunensis TaxID=2134037 RepID=A0ABW2NII8_9BACL|nr:HPr family phosphocarrier protein [Bhargavaea sp. CC-171006]